MTSTPERRKHSACVLRIRESCLFRKLRKTKCGGVPISAQSVSSSGVSLHNGVLSWRDRFWKDHQSTVLALENCAHTHPRSAQDYYHHHQQQGDHAAMDAEAVPSMAGISFSNLPAGTYTQPVSEGSNLMRLHQSSLSTSDPSMELDSGVDPETGERALG